MSEPRTAGQWLALGDELAIELARVLTPKRNHNWLEPAIYYGHSDPLGFVVKCQKCGHVKTIAEEIDGCGVPDPIKIDWNTAVGWARKVHALRFHAALLRIFDIVRPDGDFQAWIMFGVTSDQWLIAAAIAVERSKE